MKRRVNDAQVERLLTAMRSLDYRQELTRNVLKREGVRQFTPTGKIRAEYRRRYNSIMRRFQRYVTESAEKRSFARAPMQYQRQTRAIARAIPVPPARPLPPTRIIEREADFYEPSSNTILRALVAYYDGDTDEAAQAMDLSDRGTRLLALATEDQGVGIATMRGAGEVYDKLADLLDTLPSTDIGDLQDFHDLLMDLPEWKINLLMEDLAEGDSTFADWLDDWRDDGPGLDSDWELWRALTKQRGHS